MSVLDSPFPQLDSNANPTFIYSIPQPPTCSIASSTMGSFDDPSLFGQALQFSETPTITYGIGCQYGAEIPAMERFAQAGNQPFSLPFPSTSENITIIESPLSYNTTPTLHINSILQNTGIAPFGGTCSSSFSSQPPYSPLSSAQAPSPPHTHYVPIAPKSDELLQNKLTQLSEYPLSYVIEIDDEDYFLLRLRDEEGLGWKDISNRFQKRFGKEVKASALGMRLKRLRERLQERNSWNKIDIDALRMAHDYWVNSKFEIIASKMLECGAVEKWNAKQCSRKWQEIGSLCHITPGN